MKIAVDALGGDRAPRDVVRGAVLAAREYDLRIVLVGVEAKVREELASAGGSDDRIELVHAPDVVGMDDSPGVSLRRK